MKIDAKLDKRMAEVSFENAKPVSEIPALKARQMKKQQEQEAQQKQILDNDVQSWLVHQTPATIQQINNLIRSAMALKMA